MYTTAWLVSEKGISCEPRVLSRIDMFGTVYLVDKYTCNTCKTEWIGEEYEVADIRPTENIPVELKSEEVILSGFDHQIF